MVQKPPIGIYIHIPFCQTRCGYCDFYSQTHLERQEEYLQALMQELASRRTEYIGHRVNTLYIGGGTPSLLPIEWLAQLMGSLQQHIDLSEAVEITIEANPSDLSERYLQQLLQLGIKRLSIGIQSFADSDLSLIGRRHNGKQAIEAVERAQQAGYDNISIDLIYGLPNQSLDSWQRNLEIALSLATTHISAYHLTYEPGTRFYQLLDRGLLEPCSEEHSLLLFNHLIETLTSNGYEQYEISNFAKDQHYSIHNSSYWMGTPYIGLGPAAHSYIAQTRRSNISDIERYIEAINRGDTYYETEFLGPLEQYNDYIITRIRTQWGISLTEIEQLFSHELADKAATAIDGYIQRGVLERNQVGNYRLTRQGIMISDTIMEGLIEV